MSLLDGMKIDKAAGLAVSQSITKSFGPGGHQDFYRWFVAFIEEGAEQLGMTQSSLAVATATQALAQLLIAAPKDAEKIRQTLVEGIISCAVMAAEVATKSKPEEHSNGQDS